GFAVVPAPPAVRRPGAPRPAVRRSAVPRLAVLLLVMLLLAGCGAPAPASDPGARPGNGVGHESPAANGDHEAAVRSVVEAFGRQPRQVTRLAPMDQARQALEDHNAPYVTEELLAAGRSDPRSAPGRTVSSPWPDRIEIESAALLPGGTYRVDGRVIEVTSGEHGRDEAAATRPITLILRLVDERWLIDQVTLGDV